MRIQLKSKDELRLMREAGLVAAEILEDICAAAKPGVSTWELDKIAAQGHRQAQGRVARSSATTATRPCCARSINEVVVHGIPRKNEILKDGDIIGIDFGIFKHGFCADTARTRAASANVSEEKQKLSTPPARRSRTAIELCSAGQSARRPRPRDPELCGITRLFGRPPVRRPRHRPADARGPAGSEFRRGRQRQTHENRPCHRR